MAKPRNAKLKKKMKRSFGRKPRQAAEQRASESSPPGVPAPAAEQADDTAQASEPNIAVPRNPPAPTFAWEPLQIKGGEIRVNTKLSRIDAHCRGCGHGAGCKMDRTGAKGPLGLSLLWLKWGKNCASKEEHEALQSGLAVADFQAQRDELRHAWKASAASQAGVYQAALDIEMEKRGDISEPPAIL